MQEPPVLNWDKTIHKNTRTSDDEPAGYIAAEDSESIIVLAGGFREYKVPKSHVVEFDGSQVFLDFTFRELEQYRIA